ncbi:MAG TPA: DNA-3-methyladenine glycosylase [Pararhizobium sp.]|nr:DNA-3-methyladenine glycosylase [Pararhizobium sp.]
MRPDALPPITRIDTPADIESGLAGLATLDPRLVAVAERAGQVPLRRDPPGFTGLARIIVGQMVSRASADAIWRRMEALSGRLTAKAYAGYTAEICREVGLSRAKEEALRAVALAEIEGALDLETLCDLPAEEAIARLTAIRGIGAWTAEVYLLFCAGHPDVFPAGDVALQNAVAHAFGLDARPSPRGLASMAEEWSPWRGVAARLFWAYYSKEMRRSVLPIG